MIVDAGPETALPFLYRARAFQSTERLKEALMSPDKQLGPPPATLALSGRMNANGVSVFYGANNDMAALAEVRPPVGCDVALARFDIIRPVRLLDLTAVDGVVTNGSIFEPKYKTRLEHHSFLKKLSRRITKPVMPEHESMDYLITQAIADYLASDGDLNIDGILFPSVQSLDALNVVLFHAAAAVEQEPQEENCEARIEPAYTEDEGWSREYSIFTEVKEKEKSDDGLEDFSDWLENPVPSPFFGMNSQTQSKVDHDAREPTIRIDIESITVHEVKSVEFKTQEIPVNRHRIDRRQVHGTAVVAKEDVEVLF